MRRLFVVQCVVFLVLTAAACGRNEQGAGGGEVLCSDLSDILRKVRDLTQDRLRQARTDRNSILPGG
ncbi:hypothetical protein AB0M80_19015 [Amycolatopsis sp. NPDC051045]|uniref:hypothetical protein n=1 Tax=Amycolatopsis sp. NPDC051045 TaxID=3156922 RepID=UPI0034191F1C